jgi:hypothetical protein
MARALINFINNVQNVGARVSNQWEMDVSTGYADVDDKLKDITMYASGFQTPSRTQNFGDVHFKGYPAKVPTHIIMQQEHTFNVRCDIQNNVHKLFLKWQNYVTDMSITNGSFLGGAKRIPKTSFVRLHMLAEDMETILTTYKLVGCSVSDVGALEMAAEGGTVVTFPVKLISQYWEVEKTTGDFQEQK